jgi:DNA-binding transcriptional LysR family regulator
MELGSAEAIKQGVMAGLGISALSLHNLRLEIAAGQIVVLKVEGFPLRRQWNVVHRKGKRLSPAALGFIEFLQNEGQQLVNEAMPVKP